MAKKQKTDEQKLVEQAHKHFALSSGAESESRAERLDDVKFVRLGDQWPENVKRDREQPGRERPCLVINRLFQFRNQVINEIRQNSPSIKFKQADGEAHEKAAAVREDLVRRIQYDSSADIAYDTAAEWQVDTGLGWFRVYTDYCDPDSFEQDVKIAAVYDPFKVYDDPRSVELDGSDAKFRFVIEEYTRDDFEREYPDVDVSGWDSAGTGDSSGWYGSELVRVAEYFYIDQSPITLALMQDGSTINKAEIPEEFQSLIVRERKSTKSVCKWVKISGDKIIEGPTELPTSYIPVIPVFGSCVWIEGKRRVHGLTRHAKDPQRLYNYSQSANTETLALAPKAPFIGAVGQFSGMETEWQSANHVNFPYLEYNPVDVNGSALPAPQRQPGPGTNPGFEAAMARSIDDMKSTMGIFDASLGDRESEQSGKAILSQQRQASIGNFHFSDNLARSLKHAGKIINEMLSVYDTQRVMQVIGADGTEKSIVVDPQAPQAFQEIDGKPVYNLAKGKYSVIVDVGPSYATKRQEAAESMMQLAQADPQLMAIAGDIIVKNMDWPEAEEIAKRKKAMLPPQIMSLLQEDVKNDVPPEVEQMMNQMADQIQQMSQDLQAATDQHALEEEKLDIERFNAQTKRMDIEHKIAMEQVMNFHNIAQQAAMSVSETLAQPNTGELDDLEEPQEQQTAQPEPEAMPEPMAQPEPEEMPEAMPMEQPEMQPEMPQPVAEPMPIQPQMESEESKKLDVAIDMLQEMRADIVVGNQQLIEVLTRPKKVVRDENGKIAGVE